MTGVSTGGRCAGGGEIALPANRREMSPRQAARAILMVRTGSIVATPNSTLPEPGGSDGQPDDPWQVLGAVNAHERPAVRNTG